jgi:hypothetical protein
MPPPAAGTAGYHDHPSRLASPRLPFPSSASTSLRGPYLRRIWGVGDGGEGRKAAGM